MILKQILMDYEFRLRNGFVREQGTGDKLVANRVLRSAIGYNLESVSTSWGAISY
jgi:hypothetical protein